MADPNSFGSECRGFRRLHFAGKLDLTANSDRTVPPKRGVTMIYKGLYENPRSKQIYREACNIFGFVY